MCKRMGERAEESVAGADRVDDTRAAKRGGNRDVLARRRGDEQASALSKSENDSPRALGE